MNITARQSQSLDRVANDFYPTDHGFTRVMLESLPVTLSGPILEPCAGERDIVEILRQSGLQVEDTDIIDSPGMDATTDEYWSDRAPDWTITNPPFNQATKILQQAYQNSRRGVLIFLRITYLEPCPDRAEWLDAHADQLRWCQVVNPRPIFRADTNKTDSATCVWLLWDKHWSWLSPGIEPPFRFSNGARCLLDKRRTAFPRSAPKLMALSAGKIANLQENPDPNFYSLAAQPTESKPVNLALQLIDALSEEADQLKAEGVAAASQYLNEQVKGDRIYCLLRWVVKGQVKSKSLKPAEVAEARSRIDRRNRVQFLEYRIAELQTLISKLE